MKITFYTVLELDKVDDYTLMNSHFQFPKEEEVLTRFQV
jgi:hypothetical protein